MKNAAAAWESGCGDEHAQLFGELPLGHLYLRHGGADPVRAHHPFGLAGGATSEHHRGDVLGAYVGCLQRLRLEALSHCQVVFADLCGAEGKQVFQLRYFFLQCTRNLRENGGIEYERVDLGGFKHVGVVVQ